ncbi:MAG TPA: hypothetical protein VGI58_12310 [Streptosporangiaceae bacterium]
MSGAAPPPSWLRVIRTTLRLWLRRRVLRVSDSGRLGGARVTGLAFIAVVIVAVAGGSAVAATGHWHVVTRSWTRLTDGHPSRPTAKPEVHPSVAIAQSPSPSPEQSAATANGQAAAVWIAAQVGPQTTIGCDPAMCAQLQAAGYPASAQVAVQPGANLPSGVTLVISTPVLRADGVQAADVAPVLIAGFGTGQAAVEVRAIVPGGAAAFVRLARNDVAAWRSAGRSLARTAHVRLHAAARQELTTGRVDPRLIVLLGRVAARYSFDIAKFADAGPDAGVRVPFRMVRIDDLTTASGTSPASGLTAIVKLVTSQGPRYRARYTVIHTGSRVVLQLLMPAPSPF